MDKSVKKTQLHVISPKTLRGHEHVKISLNEGTQPLTPHL